MGALQEHLGPSFLERLRSGSPQVLVRSRNDDLPLLLRVALGLDTPSGAKHLLQPV